MNGNFDIDFVIPWVDGSDLEWIKSFNKYAPAGQERGTDSSAKRYRDYGLLRYWFRGVEKFAPWVRKVHFITCGQKPDWLNLDAPKLHWVRHSDYIPQEYLPVFSSHPIELYMHKIPGLAEQIVYFNDDLFLTAPVRKNFFFKNGLPRDSAVLNAISTCKIRDIVFNNLDEIERNFKKAAVLKHFSKWFNPIYGKELFRTVCLLPWPKFTGFLDMHFAQGFCKSTIKDAWLHCEERLSQTMENRFRSRDDVNQWLFRYWHLCKGAFCPEHPRIHKQYFELSADINEIVNAIKKQKYKEIVLNDADTPDYEAIMKKISNAFEKILPEKSSFEVQEHLK